MNRRNHTAVFKPLAPGALTLVDLGISPPDREPLFDLGAVLAALPALRRLKLGFKKADRADVSGVRRSPALASLVIDAVALCPALRELTLQFAEVGPGDIDAIAKRRDPLHLRVHMCVAERVVWDRVDEGLWE